VFISGRGSNLAAALDIPSIDIRLVVTSDADAAGVMKARRAGVPVLVLPTQALSKNSPSPKKQVDWTLLDSELRARSIDAIFLLGFMKIVPETFVRAWEGRILNLHPSLLPSYPGLKSIERAFHDRAPCGATVHEVVAEVDAGRVLRSRRSYIFDARTSASLAEVERLVHVDEQCLVKEIVERWRPRSL
jgi:phosphoribosylglycinamide formyltransferase-1